MRVVLQRVTSSKVHVEGEIVASIGNGLLLLLGIRNGDSRNDATNLADKCSVLRVFSDGAGKMNLSVQDIGGELLVVSQFTLYGDTYRGTRPSFSDAAPPDEAEQLYDAFCVRLKEVMGEKRVQTGQFGAMMQVELTNDGPVTLIVESKGSPGTVE